MIPLYETEAGILVQFQQMPASMRGVGLATKAHMGHMRGLGQTTYMGVKVGRLVEQFVSELLQVQILNIMQPTKLIFHTFVQWG